MQIHHDKHHAAYVANLNKAVAEFPDVAKMSVEEMLKNLNAVPEKIRTAVRNQGGGHLQPFAVLANAQKGWRRTDGRIGQGHRCRLSAVSAHSRRISPKPPPASLAAAGPGWWWMADKQLSIEPTANQDSPVSQGKQPLLGIDVWEHAYYLKYQNRRPEYVAAFFNVINWDFVSDRYEHWSLDAGGE